MFIKVRILLGINHRDEEFFIEELDNLQQNEFLNFPIHYVLLPHIIIDLHLIVSPFLCLLWFLRSSPTYFLFFNKVPSLGHQPFRYVVDLFTFIFMFFLLYFTFFSIGRIQYTFIFFV